MLPSVSPTGPPSTGSRQTGPEAVRLNPLLQQVWHLFPPLEGTGQPGSGGCVVHHSPSVNASQLSVHCVWDSLSPFRTKDRPTLDHIIGCVDHITHSNTGVTVCGDFNQLRDAYLNSSCQVVTSKRSHHVPACRHAALHNLYTNIAVSHADISVLPPPPAWGKRPLSGAVPGGRRGHLQTSCCNQGR